MTVRLTLVVIPLEQGLKLKSYTEKEHLWHVHSRSNSIRTRIETYRDVRDAYCLDYSRSNSIRTRIETCSRVIFQTWCWPTLVVIPLEQGLKHGMHKHRQSSGDISLVALPLEQGLKRIYPIDHDQIFAGLS